MQVKAIRIHEPESVFEYPVPEIKTATTPSIDIAINIKSPIFPSMDRSIKIKQSANKLHLSYLDYWKDSFQEYQHNPTSSIN